MVERGFSLLIKTIRDELSQNHSAISLIMKSFIVAAFTTMTLVAVYAAAMDEEGLPYYSGRRFYGPVSYGHGYGRVGYGHGGVGYGHGRVGYGTGYGHGRVGYHAPSALSALNSDAYRRNAYANAHHRNAAAHSNDNR